MAAYSVDLRTRVLADGDAGLKAKQVAAKYRVSRASVHRLVQRRRRFLPPYSPDFNPIEQAFAKLKAFLRAARPRTFDHVCELIATAMPFFIPAECANYVRHSRYRIATT